MWQSPVYQLGAEPPRVLAVLCAVCVDFMNSKGKVKCFNTEYTEKCQSMKESRVDSPG